VYERSESADHEQVTLRLAEEVSFLNKVRINRVLHEMPAGATVTVDGTRSRYIDPDVVELLHEFRTRASIKNITLRLRGIPEPRALHAHT
jgi:MFS superfamily sulfate permease-like transporter